MDDARPRILLLTPKYPRQTDAALSGLSVYARLAAGALRDAGAEVHVLGFLERDASRLGLSTEDGILVHRINLGWQPVLSSVLPNVLAGRRLLEAVRRLEADHGYAAIEMPNLEGMGWALSRNVPNLWIRLHTPQWEGFAEPGARPSMRTRFIRWLDGVAVRGAAHLITHSAVHAEAMRTEYHLGKKPITVVPHGVPDPGRSGPRRVPGRLLAIGPLWQRKGADILLEAFARIAPAHPQASLVLVGPHPDPVLHSRVAELQGSMPDGEQRLRAPGPLRDSELAKEWSEASIVVLASRYESFGLVAIEAMARAIPLVSSNAGALPEVTGGAALLFDNGDPEGLAQRVAELLANPTLATSIGEAGRGRYQQAFTTTRMGRGMLKSFLAPADSA